MANTKELLHRYIDKKGNVTTESVDAKKFLVSLVTTLRFCSALRTRTGELGTMGFSETKLFITVGTSALYYFD